MKNSSSSFRARERAPLRLSNSGGEHMLVSEVRVFQYVLFRES